MTIQQLQYVLALDKTRHFVSAAEMCFVTQPTLTVQIQKLESDLTYPIFDRSSKPIKPTEFGKLFIKKARAVIREYEDLQNLTSNLSNDLKGTFKIGVIPTLAPYIIPKFIYDFVQQFPETNLLIEEMKTEEITKALEEQRLDIGLLVTPLKLQSIKEYPLGVEPFLYYGHPDHSCYSKETITTADIESLNDIWLLDKGHCFREQVLNICRPKNDHRHLKFNSGSIETIKKLVENYGGFTLVPEMSITADEQKHSRKITGNTPVREISLVTHRHFYRQQLIAELSKSIQTIIPNQYIKGKHRIIDWIP